MKKLLLALAALLLIPGAVHADDLSTTLAGTNGQGFAVLVADGGQVTFEIFTNGIGDITDARIFQTINPFLDLGASGGSAAVGSVPATASQIASLNGSTSTFTLVVTGTEGELSGVLVDNGPSQGGGSDGGGDGGDDGGGDDSGGEGGDPEGPNGQLIDTGDTSPCVDGPTTLCLLAGDRFEVTVDFATNQGTGGQGNRVELTSDTGTLWFFSQTNVEMVVKVLDSCLLPENIGGNRFWVFAGGLTNVEVEMKVRDTQTGIARRFRNPQVTPFRPIQATDAFATCP